MIVQHKSVTDKFISISRVTGDWGKHQRIVLGFLSSEPGERHSAKLTYAKREVSLPAGSRLQSTADWVFT